MIRLSILVLCALCPLLVPSAVRGQEVPAGGSERSREFILRGTLVDRRNVPMSGQHPVRIHFFSSISGGTPLGAAIDLTTRFDADGTFGIVIPSTRIPAPPKDLWFCMLVDWGRDGFNENDYVIGSYYAGRSHAVDGPFEAKIHGNHIPEGNRSTTNDTIVSKIRADYSTPPDGVINVKELGAIGDGVSDDTAVIQAAIDRLQPHGGRIFFPSGTYSIRSLNLTNRAGLALTGPATLAATLVVREDDVHLLDLSGSAYCQIENLTISGGVVQPKTALLLCQNEKWSGNAAHLENLYASGKFSMATLYCTGFQSSDAVNCDFYNYRSDETPVVYFSRNNRAGVNSKFIQVSAKPIITSDWTFTACEIHSFAAQHGGASEATALVLDGVEQMRWIGGNISGSGPQYVLLRESPRWIIFQGTTFYSDNGSPAGSVFHVEGGVNGLTVNQCHAQSRQAIFSGTAGTTFDAVSFTSYLPQERPSRKPGVEPEPVYLLNCAGGTLVNSLMFCAGGKIAVGSINGSLLLDAGPIDAVLHNSLALGDGQPLGQSVVEQVLPESPQPQQQRAQ